MCFSLWFSIYEIIPKKGRNIMENATKALLIAGSILIAILLIAMGLRIFNSTSETTEQSQRAMDTTAVATFNNQFIPYLGENKSRAQAI